MAGPVVGPISRRSTFRALRRPAGRATRGPVQVRWVPRANDDQTANAQVAYLIGKRCGNAVHRNRLRRRLRAAVREIAGGLPPGSYLIAADPAAEHCGFFELRGAVQHAMTTAAGHGLRKGSAR